MAPVCFHFVVDVETATACTGIAHPWVGSIVPTLHRSRAPATQRYPLLPGLVSEAVGFDEYSHSRTIKYRVILLGRNVMKTVGMCPVGSTNMIRLHIDKQLEQRFDRLEVAVEEWAKQNDLWRDAIFKRVVKSFDMDTGAPTVTTLCADGSLAELVIHPGMGAIHQTYEAQRLSDECQGIIESHGFYGEPFDEGRLNIIPLEQNDTLVFQRIKEYMRWKWICSLIQGDFDALNPELYDYFSKKPDQFTRLEWREFEKLVAEVLEAQGFVTELGPGHGDGGVDIRLLQRDPIGDVMTLVQVKKYDAKYPIRLEAVQALHGAKAAEEADNSMFVTTSRYLPSAKYFASRDNVQMKLHVSDDVQKWCADATAGIIEDKNRIVSDDEVLRALHRARRDPKTIMHARGGYNMLYNQFCLVLKESASSGLAIDLPKQIVQHDGYKQAGTEVPDLRDDRKVLQLRGTASRLKKLSRDSGFKFSDIDEEFDFYMPWNQEPAQFYGD